VNEMQKTAIHAGVAGLLLLLAVSTRTWNPGDFQETPAEEGTPFFPAFTDFTQATSLEVWEFDAEKGEAAPFKVELQSGVWRIPSKENYPADAKDKLGKTAAALMRLTRDSLRSSRESDQVACGVVDPAAPGGAAEGRGKRITLRDVGGKTLADIIIGKTVEGASNLRYARLPSEKTIYAVRAGEVEPSTKFGDWIEKDLLGLDVAQITTVTVDKYSVDEELLRTQGAIRIEQGERIVLGKKDGQWALGDQKPEEKIAQYKVGELTGAIDELQIVDVAPYSDERLVSAGFFVTQRRVYSNEGELIVELDDGVVYIIRFGEALPGEGDEGLRRYVVIDAQVNQARLPRGPDGQVSPETKKQAEQRATELNERFAQWYYVISAKSYDVLRPARASLLEESMPEHGEDDGHEHGPEEPAFPPVDPNPPQTPPPSTEQAPPPSTEQAPPPTTEQAPPPGQ
jgi:hypothetical protein